MSDAPAPGHAPAAVDDSPIATPHGVLYPPVSWPLQAASFIAALAGGPSAGYLLARATGVPDGWGRFTCIAAFFAAFILGYMLWLTRVKAILATAFGGTVVRILLALAWHALWRREPDQAVHDRLKAMAPDTGTIQKVVVKMQRAASSFAFVSLPVGMAASAAVALLPGAASPLLSATLLLPACVAYGLAVARLGRRGYLPMSSDFGE